MVLSNKKSRKSARVLHERLQTSGYQGNAINYGCSVLRHDYGEVINTPQAVAKAVNKRVALQLLKDADIPTPLVDENEAIDLLNYNIKIVGRPDYHSKGRSFYVARTQSGIERAKRLGATHFLKFIDDALEFRVHIVNGQSIKISQKVFPEGLEANRRNHRFGATFEYPHEFNHRKTLRRIAKESIEVLGLDFGAVDLLYREEYEVIDGSNQLVGKFYVLEINTAPCLTDEQSDTLDRYARAFQSVYSE